MKQTDILAELQAAGLVLALLDDQLVIKRETVEKVTQKTLALLTDKRKEVKAILQAQEKDCKQKKPFIDKNYHRGQEEKGCLVIPSGCAARYQYWMPSFSCIPVNTDDWYGQYQKLPDKEKKKLQWKPMSIRQILLELGASAKLVNLYCKKKIEKNCSSQNNL